MPVETVPSCQEISGAPIAQGACHAARSLSISVQFGGDCIEHSYLQQSSHTATEYMCLDGSGLLVRAHGQGFVLRFEREGKGWFHSKGRTRSLAQLAQDATLVGPSTFEVSIPNDCTISLQFGCAEIWIRSDADVQRLGRPSLSLGRELLAYAGGVALACMVLAWCAASLPETVKRFTHAQFVPRHFVSAQHVVSIAAEKARPHMAQRPLEGRASSRPKLSHRVEVALLNAELAEQAESAVAGARVRERARQAGIAGVMISTEASLAKVRASVDFRYSEELAEQYGELRPGEVSGKTGAWGHGIQKIGPGSGDGKHWGTVKSSYRMASTKQRGDAYEARMYESLRKPTIRGARTIFTTAKSQVVAHRVSFRRCFPDAAPERLSDGPLVSLHIQVLETGRASLSISPEHLGVSAKECAEEVLHTISFPRASEGEIRKVQLSVRL